MTAAPARTDAISTSLRLAKSLDLAKRGQLKAAQSVFGLGSQLPADPVELHALAALVTKEGDYTRALQLWRLLLTRVPSHSEARRMMDAIELWQMRPAWYGVIPWVAGAVGALIVTLIFGALLSGPEPSRKPEVTAPAVVAPTVAPTVPPAMPTEPAHSPGVKFPSPKSKKTNR